VGAGINLKTSGVGRALMKRFHLKKSRLMNRIGGKGETRRR
jgi:hypothetical protein